MRRSSGTTLRSPKTRHCNSSLFFSSLAGPRDKQFVFAIRAKLGLTPQMDVGPYAYACGRPSFPVLCLGLLCSRGGGSSNSVFLSPCWHNKVYTTTKHWNMLLVHFRTAASLIYNFSLQVPCCYTTFPERISVKLCLLQTVSRVSNTRWQHTIVCPVITTHSSAVISVRCLDNPSLIDLVVWGEVFLPEGSAHVRITHEGCALSLQLSLQHMDRGRDFLKDINQQRHLDQRRKQECRHRFSIV